MFPLLLRKDELSLSLLLFPCLRYSTLVSFFSSAFWSALLKPQCFLKPVWTIHLTLELNLQQSITAKPAWSLPDRETKRTVTFLRKREGIERTLVSVVTIGMTYNRPLCLYVSSTKLEQWYLPSFPSKRFQDWWMKRLITKLSIWLLSSH